MRNKIISILVTIMFIACTAWAIDKFYPSGTPGTGELGKDGKHWGSLYLKEQIVFEGDTNDDYEITLDVGDPAADITIALPNANSAAFMISTLTTNDVDAANSVWGVSNGLTFEGATADAYETNITPTDPTADRTITIPNMSGAPILSTLTTNAADAANSVWGGTNQVILEGATADTYELVLTPTDPTGDRTMTLPEMSANSAVMASTLTTNAADVANSVWGASNGIVLEGATADTYELTLTTEDPTADNTMTFSDDTGSVAYTPTGGTTSAADSLAIPITHAYVAKTTGADAEALTLANGNPGQILTIALVTDGGGDGTLTPTTKSGFTSIVFADAGDIATLMYVDDTVGWVILGTAGTAAPPVTV